MNTVRDHALLRVLATSEHAKHAPGPLTKDTLALILAGGRGSRLEELTNWRAKPLLPFGGKFRIVDFKERTGFSFASVTNPRSRKRM